MIESNAFKIGEVGSKAALVYGQKNETTGARARLALTGLKVAEYFRDEEGQDVLLFVDNIFRFTKNSLFRSICFIRSYSICCRLSSNSSYWFGKIEL